MNKLTVAELVGLDAKLESSVPTSLFHGITRGSALMHLLRVYEDFNREIIPMSIDESGEGWGEATKSAQDGMHYAILWIYKHYSNEDIEPIRNFAATNQKVYSAMLDLHDAAQDYSVVWDFMGLCFSEARKSLSFMQIDRISNEHYSIGYVKPGDSLTEVADRIINATDDPTGTAGEKLANCIDRVSLFKEAKPKKTKSQSLAYTFPKKSFQKYRAAFLEATAYHWELHPDWSVGDYTIGEYQNFWATLSTLSQIHSRICFDGDRIGVEQKALNDLIMVKSRQAWSNELARLSGLPFKTVMSIISDLTFDPDLYLLQENAGKLDATCQPFFDFGNNNLALSNWLVMLSNAERNLWALINVVRPKIHGDLRNKKEKLWVERLVAHLNKLGLSACGPINFSFNEKPRDIDVLIYDSKIKFVLLCELKWGMSPDKIKDVLNATSELEKGLEQAEIGLKWSESNRAELCKSLHLKPGSLDDAEIRAIVLHKNFMGKGRLKHPEIPIVSERLMNWIIESPNRKSIRTLWRCCIEQRYLPKIGVHFTESDVDICFGAIKFTGTNYGMRILRDFDPAKDIDLTGI